MADVLFYGGRWTRDGGGREGDVGCGTRRIGYPNQGVGVLGRSDDEPSSRRLLPLLPDSSSSSPSPPRRLVVFSLSSLFRDFVHVMQSSSREHSAASLLNPAASLAPAASFSASPIALLLGSVSVSSTTRVPLASYSRHGPGHDRTSVPSTPAADLARRQQYTLSQSPSRPSTSRASRLSPNSQG